MTSKMTIPEWNEDERPRERLLAKGASSLSEAELIAIIIGSGTKNETAVDLARKILVLGDNNLRSLSVISIDKLREIKGIGQSKAISIIAAGELAKRISLTHVKQLSNIGSSSYAAKIISPILRDLSHEECWILYLNRANKLISKERLSSGGVSSTIVDVKIIIKNALERLASSIILVHNHPSGNPNPGENDKQQTKILKNAAAMFDISLIDHLIIAGDTYYSFADEGLMV